MVKGLISSDSVSPVSAASNAISGINVAVDGHLASEQVVQNPPTSCYDYYNAGYNGTLPQFDDKDCSNAAGGSYTGIQPDNALPQYYSSGYVAYQTYTSPEYLQQPSSYDSEALYTYDSTNYRGNGLTGAATGSSSVKAAVGPSGSGRSNGKANDTLSSKTSALFRRPIYQNQSYNPQNRLGSGFQSVGPTSRSYPTVRNPHAPAQYDSAWNSNQRYKSRDNFHRSGENKAAIELTCGPRAHKPNNSSKSPSADEQFSSPIKRDRYNLQDFQTVYDSAKFYVIKSYSEDDIHKSIKYDVWSSTPNGNRKLDAAFGEANARNSETGINCPVFLFFSVNASGQFVGVAEMIGPVDFSKSMDFWQLDKWNGFFPVKWHLIKDVPNMLLRHIILVNNDNRPVTYTRDTQEIGLKQGLEMLSIFKNYSANKSLLDDFNFYEKREKELKAKRKAKPASSQTHGLENDDYEGHLLEYGEGAIRDISAKKTDTSSLISLTKNLSLNS